MDLNKRIELEEQTLRSLKRIRDNGGVVPDGDVLECSPDGLDWCKSVQDYTAMFYRLTPIKPPRFTVSSDPCGVLDSERPGWIALFTTAELVGPAIEKLKTGAREPADYGWSELPKPQIPLGPEDVPPGSVVR